MRKSDDVFSSKLCQNFIENMLENRGIDRVIRKNSLSVVLVLGCVDGLVCFLDALGCFHFWNPSIRVSTDLPKLGCTSCLTPGFGFDESTVAFKVFTVESESYEIKVYSSKSNSWKLLETGGILSKTAQSGILVRRKLHWLRRISGKLDIVSFDIKSEAFGEIELSPFALLEHRDYGNSRDEVTRLGVVGGRLSSLLGFTGFKVEVWVMEEYGLKESWTKLVNLQPPYSLAAPFFTGPDGEILFVYGPNFLVYYPKDKAFRFYGPHSFFRGVYHCVESLVTPDYIMLSHKAALQLDLSIYGNGCAPRVVFVALC